MNEKTNILVAYFSASGVTRGVAEKIAECARKHGIANIFFADTYDECLKLCTKLAQPGDAVLLSPACASWGMFPNYETRGKLFKEYVNALSEEE